ncbi:MAG: periplasmic protein TonB [Pyrinomonadaceae bacterium]|nr:periplasmic protein TonB [Pyrinomonadaceae bacterium]
MKKLPPPLLLLSIFLLAPLGQDAPGVARGQSAPAPAQTSAPQTATTTAATPAQEAALKEALDLSVRAVQLYQAGNFDEALPLAERALALREGALAANDRRIADALANVAALRLIMNDLDKAETFYRRALAVYEASGDTEGKAVMTVLERLVYVSAMKRDLDRAEASAQRILAIAEKNYKPQQLEMARALVHPAEVSRLRLDKKRARTLYARIVDIVEQYAPATVPKEITLSLANYLGLLYAEEGGSDSKLTERITKLFVAIASAAPPGTGTEVQGGIINGKAVYKPQPEYPQSAKSARAQGTVRVQILVDETGRVIEAKVFDNAPHGALANAALAAAKRARFTPTLLSGVPVKVTGFVTYNFVLQFSR